MAVEVLDVDGRAEALPLGVDLVVLPGGFAHGDALRAGALAARSPILGAVRAHAEAGRLVVGICNGFQILTEAGLLPGVLLPNLSGRFVARDVWVRAEPGGPFAAWGTRRLRWPVAHAVGRYEPTPHRNPSFATESGIALRYDETDGPSPNGGVIAGVFAGPRRNVLGLMPHPERRVRDDAGVPPDGRLFFDAILRYDRARP
jgi:phosphoribosylformylglycinamidine synthase